MRLSPQVSSSDAAVSEIIGLFGGQWDRSLWDKTIPNRQVPHHKATATGTSVPLAGCPNKEAMYWMALENKIFPYP